MRVKGVKIVKKEIKDRQKPFKIGGETIEPGMSKKVRLPFSMLPNHATLDLNMRIIHGHRPGKCLLLSSTIHGDELNGIEIIRRVLASPHVKHLKGTLVALPVVNLIGLLNQSRYLPDRRDLNRSSQDLKQGEPLHNLQICS